MVRKLLGNIKGEKGESMYYDVKNYGAVGDGLTDDTVAIQNLISDVDVYGSTIYFPPGSYLINNTLEFNNDNINVICDGLIVSRNVVAWMIRFNASFCKISVKIDGDNKASNGINNLGESNTIENCLIENMYNDVGSSVGLNSVNFGVTIIQNNTIRNINAPSDTHGHDDIGISRGIRINSNEHQDTVRIRDNIIENIIGAEGDAIHLFITSSLRYDHENVDIQVSGNKIHEFSRRAIKFQTCGCQAFNNEIISHGEYGFPATAIDVQYVHNTLVENNKLDIKNMATISIAGYEENNVKNVKINNNIITNHNDNTTIYATLSHELTISNNLFIGGNRAILTNNKFLTVDSNTFRNIIPNEMAMNIGGGSTEYPLVTNNTFINCPVYDKIRIMGDNAIVENNKAITEKSRIVVNGGTGIIKDNILKNSSENNIIGGTTDNHILVNNQLLLEVL